MDTILNFDPTGASIDNLVVSEVHPLDSSTFRIIAPFAGTIYTKNALLIRSDNGDTLTAGVDFLFQDIDSSTTSRTGRTTSRTIKIINNAITGNIIITYQAVGAYSKHQRTDTDIMLAKIAELQSTVIGWGSLEDKPLGFPPDPHTHKLIDGLAGVQHVRNSILYIKDHMLKVHYLVDPNLDIANRMELALDLLAEQRRDITALEIYGVLLADIEDTLSGFGVQIDAVNNSTAVGVTRTTEAISRNTEAVDLTTMIRKPAITSPVAGDVDFVRPDTYSSSIFSIPESFDGVHASTDWEISNLSDFSNIVSSSYLDTINLLEWYGNGLTVSTLYYVRCRHHSDNHISEWSDYVSFTTASDLGYLTVSLTAPLDSATDIALLPVLQSSAFTVVDGTDTHASTDWQIATDVNFDTVIYQVLASGDLTSHTVAVDGGNDTVYYVRCRHNGVSYTSDWSSVIQFTTTDFIEAVLLIGGAGGETFQSIAIDGTTGNYVCVGYSTSAGAGSNDAYIAIFDTSLVLINDRLIGGAGSDVFYKITIDPTSGNYVCVGYSTSAGAGLQDAYIAIFDTNLNLINDRLIGSASDEVFNSVLVDPNTGNYVCVGWSNVGAINQSDAYIAIFDTSLNLINDRLIGGAENDILLDVILGSDGSNYTVVGYSNSFPPLSGFNFYIVIFDVNLNLVKDKLVHNAVNASDILWCTIVDPVTGNYVCVGYSDSAGAGVFDAYIAIFDSNLNLVNEKLIGGAGNDVFYSIAIDPTSGNYVCVGYSASAGAGLQDAYIAIFDTSLTLINDRLIGSTADETFQSITIDDTTGNYICVGSSASAGAGLTDAMIMTFLKDLTLADGAIPSITALSVSSPTLTETAPAMTETSPAMTETSHTFTETSPAFTETAPVMTETFSLY